MLELDDLRRLLREAYSARLSPCGAFVDVRFPIEAWRALSQFRELPMLRGSLSASLHAALKPILSTEPALSSVIAQEIISAVQRVIQPR